MKIVIIGAGAFGTAIGTALCQNKKNEVYLLSNDERQVDDINNNHINKTIFKNTLLPMQLKCVVDKNILKDANVIMFALPSKVIPRYVEESKHFFSKEALLVNLSKGIYPQGKTIVEVLEEALPSADVVTLKGGTFAREVLNGHASMFTLGFSKKEQADLMSDIFESTNIYLDYTTDIRGVELLSAIKNIYAILMGIVDAQFNSINTRFMIFSKSVYEIKEIVKALRGREETLYLNCGIGDIGLTALNDLSRNRTLGLLIGKGYFQSNLKNISVVLEGVKTIEYIQQILPERLQKDLPLLSGLFDFFSKECENFNIDFENLVMSKPKTVLTYGTFDLLHYGHLEILRRAKSMGTKLIVGLSTDEFNEQKGKTCVMSFEKRKELLEAIEYVDLVIPEDNWEQKKIDVEAHNVDIFVMGNDWEGKFDFLKDFCEVVYFPRTEGISTTKLKSLLKQS